MMEKDCAMEKLATIQSSWDESDKYLKSELAANVNRVKHLTDENETLYKQIEEYSIRLSLANSKFEVSEHIFAIRALNIVVSAYKRLLRD